VEDTFPLLEFTVQERNEGEKKKKQKTYGRRVFLQQVGTWKLEDFSTAELSGEMCIACCRTAGYLKFRVKVPSIVLAGTLSKGRGILI
jgi:hypothetical protein